MTIYTSHSEEYRPLFEEFMKPSFDRYVEIEDGLKPDLVVTPYEVLEKMEGGGDAFFLEMAKRHQGEVVGWIGADFQFFGNPIPTIMQALQDHDIVSIYDGVDAEGLRNVVCPDFWFTWSSGVTINFFEWVIQSMAEGKFRNDECAWNEKAIVNYMPKFKSLDPRQFWTVGEMNKGCWDNDFRPEPPTSIIVHHGNWTRGVKNKRHLMATVREIVNCGRGI